MTPKGEKEGEKVSNIYIKIEDALPENYVSTIFKELRHKDKLCSILSYIYSYIAHMRLIVMNTCPS